MELADFDISSIRDNSNIIVYGGCAAGKATTIERILRCKATDETCVAFGAGAEEFSEERLEGCIRDQLRALNRGRVSGNPNRMIVLDDVMFAANSRQMRRLFTNGRCMRMGAILTQASAVELCPVITVNTDYLFVFSTVDADQLRRIYSMYSLADMFDGIDAFRQARDSAGCLVMALTPPGGVWRCAA